MPIEHHDSCTVVTGNAIDWVRLAMLRTALELEIKGIRARRGRTAYAILKSEHGWTGTRTAVLQKANALLETYRAHPDAYIAPVRPGR